MNAMYLDLFAAWAHPARHKASNSARSDELQAAMATVSRLVTGSLTLPFDMLRSAYARSVQVGLIDRSLLVNARFENVLCAAEKAALGPWARSM